jgi:hypothetical protein
MKFQIEKLIIWPRKTNFPPQIILFYPGKVNVITGASRTGKSAIIPIIDYCLGSGTCSIPIEVVRDNAIWYGVVICTSSEKFLFARKVPDGVQVSQECYVIRGNEISIPPIINEPNQNISGTKELLDSIASVPYLNRDEYAGGFNARLSFRDLTHLVFQSQDIVANQSILFYKTHETEHREKLKNWFPFILGAETLEMIRARHELEDIEKELARRNREYERAKKISNEWLQSLLGQLNVAIEYGLYDGDMPSDKNIDTLLFIAKSILDNKPDSPKTSIDSLARSRTELIRLEEEENTISQNISIAEKRLKGIEQLEKSLSGFQSSTRRKIDRLGISAWIKGNAQSENICPVCGTKGHPSAKNELEKICLALETYERVASAEQPIPAEFEREKLELRKELNLLLEERNDLQKRFDLLRSQDEDAAKYQQRTRDMFLFLGQLKSTIELVERLSGTDGLDGTIKELEQRKKELEKIVSISNVRNLTARALEELSILTLERLKTLDVDPAYKKVAPHFSLKELGIKVSGQDGAWHLLTEVGSASNWVSFHLAFTCALQEYFIRQTNPISSVPSFTIYDQPSQVYFPRIRKNLEDDNQKVEEYDPEYERGDEDEAAVKKMFETIAASILSTNGKWQAIILDHARSDIYGGINGVVEVVEWRNGNKLIPKLWYED